MNRGGRIRDTEGTYVDPPTDANTAHEICQEDGYQTVLVPVVSDADVAEIVSYKGELVPEEPQKDSAEEEQAALV
jgi:hypothetical protein